MTEAGTDPYWDENRNAYDVPVYSAIAGKQKEEMLLRVSNMDPLLEGVEIDSGNPDFHRFAALAKEAFNSNGPFAFIHLKADPWKSPGSWRIRADNMERNIRTDLVQKHLGDPP